MANPEHVRLAREGREAIARWQRLHPEEILDLSWADLLIAGMGMKGMPADLPGTWDVDGDTRRLVLYG